MKFLTVVILINSMLIPMMIGSHFLIVEPILNMDTSNFDPESKFHQEWKQTQERFLITFYVFTPVITNLVGLAYWGHFLQDRPKHDCNRMCHHETNTDDQYSDDWKEFLEKKKQIDDKNKADSEEVLKKYESMHDM